MRDTEKDIIQPNTEIGGYSVVSHIASGGMGDVYKMIDKTMGELFAMKVLREEPTSSTQESASDHFIAEARTTNRLRHNNIVTLHSTGKITRTNRPYLIMDYIGLTPNRREEVLNGKSWFISETSGANDPNSRIPLTLEQIIRKQGRIDEKIVCSLALDIAQALHYAHTFSEGCVVHCDLKPGNILLREDGHAVVADFGLSQAQHISEKIDASASSIRGTPDYMAPEQWDSKTELTPAVDIYSYGIVLYRLLTGAFPVGIWERPSKLGMNPGWDVLIDKCIRQNPEERWHSMHEITNWLQNLPNYARRVKRQQAIRNALKLLGVLSLSTLLIAAILFAIIKIKAASSAEAPIYVWEKATVNPEAFINNDLIDPLPHYAHTGELVYPEEANPTLKTPPIPLRCVDVLVIPAQVTAFERGFFDQFPRLEYIVCDTKNATFVSHDGILYRKGEPLEVVAIPPQLHGEITLPAGITQLEVPWEDATFTETTLTAHGAYNLPLTLTSPVPVTWTLPNGLPVEEAQ